MPRVFRYVLSCLTGRPGLKSIDIELTDRCPLRCYHCYRAASINPPSSKNYLNVATVKSVVRQAKSLGAFHVSLTGGEPLILRDLEEIVRTVGREGFLISLCTSAIGLTEHRLAALKAAGLDVLIMSLDSENPVIHNANRGVQGLAENVLSLCGAARSLSLGVIVNTMATSEKIRSGELIRLAAMIAFRGGLLNLTIPVAMGRLAGHSNMLLDETDWRRLEVMLRQPHIRTDTQSVFGAPHCPAGIEKLSVSPTGDVGPCQLLPAVYGNVFRDSLFAMHATARADRRSKGFSVRCPAGYANNA